MKPMAKGNSKRKRYRWQAQIFQHWYRRECEWVVNLMASRFQMEWHSECGVKKGKMYIKMKLENWICFSRKKSLKTFRGNTFVVYLHSARLTYPLYTNITLQNYNHGIITFFSIDNPGMIIQIGPGFNLDRYYASYVKIVKIINPPFFPYFITNVTY